MQALLDLYAECLQSDGEGWRLRYADGRQVPLPVRAWTTAQRAGDEVLLDHCSGPVLDLGCGPGRLTVALLGMGTAALGVDVAPGAVALARERGALVLTRSVFDRLPGTGRWRTAILADGNIGIGGDPVALLRRVVELLAPSGHLLVELGAPGTGSGVQDVRLEHGSRTSEWFPWATVSVSDVGGVADAAGLGVLRTTVGSSRWFAVLAAHGRSGIVAGKKPAAARHPARPVSLDRKAGNGAGAGAAKYLRPAG